MNINKSNYNYPPATVISIRYPLYKHLAIVSDTLTDGKPNLISLSYRTGGVTEKPWKTVVGDHVFEQSQIHGNDSAEVVLKRARSFINTEVSYNLLTFNCEHFVRLAHNLPIQSKQVQQTVIGALIGASTCILLPKVTIARFALLVSASAITSLKCSLNKL